ncbi:MAG: hypothetical protein Q4G48_01295 [Bacteroidia bacterium]|nr:hypothetical protein [Bacteroidia bacterium]
MKKAISITFILLANLVILAHAVVPHHHVGTCVEICDAWHHNHADTANRCVHFSGDFSQSNHCNSHKCLSIEDCLLEEIYIRFVNHGHVHQLTDSGSEYPLLLLYSSLGSNVLLQSDNYFLPFRQKPPSESLYILDFSQSKGLRAPPFC